MQSTSWPRLRKLSHRCEPINPAPPVIRYLAIIASYRVVSKTELAQVRRIEDVATIENHRLLEQSFDAPKIRPAKFVPFGQNQQRCGAMSRVVVSMRVLDSIAEDFPRLFHRLRIECLHPRTGVQQRFDNDDRRSVAHVVGARLESKSPNRKRQARQVIAKM